MLCCICLLDTLEAIGVSEDQGRKLNISEILSKHFWFKDDDITSSYICATCWGIIHDFHEFYENVVKCHREFYNVHLDLATIKNENSFINTDGRMQEIHEEEICLDLEVNQLEIEVDFDNLNSTKNPLAKNGIDSGSNEDEYNDANDNNSKSNDEPRINYKKEKTLANKSNTKNKRKRCRGKTYVMNLENIIETESKRAATILHNEAMIKKHIPMGCNLCVFVGKTFADIVKHFKVEHPGIKANITCCDKTFTKQFFIAQHAMTHENPDCFSCELCSKSFTSRVGLREHNIKYHPADEKLKFSCDLCPLKFSRIQLLEFHKSSHIPRDEWKFFCTKCPTKRAFASAYRLNKHDNTFHRRETNVCNVCAKEIRHKKSFERHVKEHYNDGSRPRLKCPFPNCDSSLKDELNLKLHLRKHKRDDKTYKCNLCDKICLNPRTLSTHKYNIHSKKVFKCGQCDKTFKRPLELKEHTTVHTGEVLYHCPFCPKTYNSIANMYGHKKKRHPKEWEALKKTKIAQYS